MVWLEDEHRLIFQNALHGSDIYLRTVRCITMKPTVVRKPPKIPARPVDGHKGAFGRVLIVAGNDTMIGAPALVGLSALRMGAGLVQIATPRQALLAVLGVVPELIGLALDARGGNKSLLDAAEKADVIVVGPGLGQSPKAAQRVKTLLQIERLMVIDADALNILAEGKRWPSNIKANAVLTPHPGEMQRLGKFLGVDRVPTDDTGRANLATLAASTFGQVVVLKGHRTVVADGRRVYFNRTGNSALSKAGTGDVLCGVIAALLAIGMERFEAACLATHLHGLAGEIAGKRLGLRSVLARDVTDALSTAIMRHEKS